MNSESVPKFSCAEEEISYWKMLCLKYKESLQETQDDSAEYREASRDLEAELEAQLTKAENQIKNLVKENQRLKHGLESLKEKYKQQSAQNWKDISKLEDELVQKWTREDQLQKYIKEQEKSINFLEQAHRANMSSLEELEENLNVAIERTAFLETELEEKESVIDSLQKLNDEARDFKLALAVLERQQKEISSPAMDSEHADASVQTSLSLLATPVGEFTVDGFSSPKATYFDVPERWQEEIGKPTPSSPVLNSEHADAYVQTSPSLPAAPAGEFAVDGVSSPQAVGCWSRILQIFSIKKCSGPRRWTVFSSFSVRRFFSDQQPHKLYSNVPSPEPHPVQMFE